ncbi:MAG: hypothetical protein KDA24_08630 [Deltaproteobacteria bacterium]|nr:hypothetical protein [Deltaproteobacteria bacterium]
MSSTPYLDSVRIASPCEASWSAMRGDDRSRRCEDCKLRVYNLSDMNTEEAESFLAERASKDRTCVRFYRRRDGTVLTKDCPRGMRRQGRRFKRVALAVAASMMAVGGAVAATDGPGADLVAKAASRIGHFVLQKAGPLTRSHATAGVMMVAPPPIMGGVPVTPPPPALQNKTTPTP